MKRIVLLALLFGLFTSAAARAAFAPPPILPGRTIAVAAALPAPVRALIAGGAPLADPGQAWEATDVIMDDKLPRHRLEWAIVTGGCYIVAYESGGIAHQHEVLIATYVPGDRQAKLLWTGPK
jgi:hypothetical protein